MEFDFVFIILNCSFVQCSTAFSHRFTLSATLDRVPEQGMGLANLLLTTSGQCNMLTNSANFRW